jgi:hypothetical protein
MGLPDYAENDLSARIWSLEARAALRDIEAMNLDESTGDKERYTLDLESRELRAQARKLRNQRAVREGFFHSSRSSGSQDRNLRSNLCQELRAGSRVYSTALPSSRVSHTRCAGKPAAASRQPNA